ncbi:MAG: hypothetical protein FWG01_01520 [Betaproteobacteria bacterium]|nr:hypothetical protein [Betaproteobacteria bacterium]
MGIFTITVILLCLMSREIFAQPRYHHGRHWHGGTITSFGFMFDMTPRPYPPYAYPVVIPVEPATTYYIQRRADEIPSPQYWYYCTQPQGYYPYVKECRGNWQKVIPFSPDAQ